MFETNVYLNIMIIMYDRVVRHTIEKKLETSGLAVQAPGFFTGAKGRIKASRNSIQNRAELSSF